MIGRRTLQPQRPIVPGVRFRAPSIHIKLRWLIYGWLAVYLLKTAWWLLRHPRTTVTLALAVTLAVTDLVLPAVVLVLVAVGSGCVWWAMWPGSFASHVGDPVQLRLRTWTVYRRDWQPAMVTAGLSLREAWGGDLPVLRSVTLEHGRDLLRIRMLPGQTIETWQAAAPKLAQTFAARAGRVRRVPNKPQEVLLLLTRRGMPMAPMHHVTEPEPDRVPELPPVARGAFPRQPRGGAA